MDTRNFRIAITCLLFVFIFTGCAINRIKQIEPGMDSLAEEITRKMVSNKKKTLAVFDFFNEDRKPSYPGKLLAEDLRIRLTNMGHFSVLSEKRISDVLKRKEIVLTDEDPGRWKKNSLRKSLHIDSLCTGVFIEKDDFVKLQVRLYDTEKIPLIGYFELEVTDKEITKIKQKLKKGDDSIFWQIKNEKSPYKSMIEKIDWGPLKHHFIISEVRLIHEKPIRLELGGRYYDYSPAVTFHLEPRQSFNLVPTAVLYHAYVIYKNPRPSFKAKFINPEGEVNYYFGSILHFEPGFIEWRKGEIRRGFFILPHIKELKDYRNIKITYWP